MFFLSPHSLMATGYCKLTSFSWSVLSISEILPREHDPHRPPDPSHLNARWMVWGNDLVHFPFTSSSYIFLSTIHRTSGMRGKSFTITWKLLSPINMHLKSGHQSPYTAPGHETTPLNLRTCGSHPRASSIQHSDNLLSHRRQSIFWGFSAKSSRTYPEGILLLLTLHAWESSLISK